MPRDEMPRDKMPRDKMPRDEIRRDEMRHDETRWGFKSNFTQMDADLPPDPYSYFAKANPTPASYR